MKAHLIGMGGIGMSALAQLLLAQGAKVSGSDSSEGPLLTRIRQMGGSVRLGHKTAHLDHPDLVVYSSAIAPQNPELLAARNRGIPVLHRGQMLSRLVAAQQTIAVAGAHGKSTTTALSAELLVAAGLDPTVLLGAEVENLGSNARLGHGSFAVVEADESDGSLLWLAPWAAILTNIDEEHLDYFRNLGEIVETYAAFAEQVKPDGFVIGCVDDPQVARLLSVTDRKKVSYGLTARAEVTAKEIELGPGFSRYRCHRRGKLLGSVELHIPGVHNVLNSLAVVALSDILRIDFGITQRVLTGYRGSKRRFEIQGEVGGVMVVHDYAHHPAEIVSTLQAARSFTNKRIRCVFQPHRYSRTRYLLDRFGTSFQLADEVMLLPIYGACEDPLEGAASDLLLQRIRRCGHPNARLVSSGEILEELLTDSKPGDLVLFLGAGSIGNLAPKFLEILSAHTTCAC